MAATASIPKTIYTGALVHTPTFGALTIEPHAHVGVDGAGVIAFIATTPAELAAARTAHAFDAATTAHIALARPGTTSFLAPGFTDSHTHAPQYPNTGLFGTSTLLSWLATYTFPMESSFSDLARARRVYTRAVRRALAHGTTCAAYYATIHVPATNLLADICWAAGQRALVGRVCMDRLAPETYRDASVAAGVADTRACIAHVRGLDAQGAVVRPVVTPRFAPSCSGAMLAALGEVAREEGCWAQTHISENTAECALVRELFPGAASYAGVYDEAGLLHERCILAHAIHLSDEEIELVRARGAKISHCPASNTCLTSGALRLKHLHRKGIDVSLGTDMSGGYSPSILEMARQAMSVSRHVAMHETSAEAAEETKLTVAEALYFATLGGAKSVGLEDKVGTFQVGKEFDAQLIRLHHVQEDGELEPASAPVDAFGWESWEDAIAKWMYTGDDRNVSQVWVRGRRVHGLEELHPGPPPTT